MKKLKKINKVLINALKEARKVYPRADIVYVNTYPNYDKNTFVIGFETDKNNIGDYNMSFDYDVKEKLYIDTATCQFKDMKFCKLKDLKACYDFNYGVSNINRKIVDLELDVIAKGGMMIVRNVNIIRKEK